VLHATHGGRNARRGAVRSLADVGLILYYLRNGVYCVYREARHLGGRGRHPGLERKIGPSARFFTAEGGKRMASHAYYESTRLSDPRAILALYERPTSLSLDELETLFSQGQWHTSYGGERWATIVRSVKRLVEAVSMRDWPRADGEVATMSSLGHNSGPLTGKFFPRR